MSDATRATLDWPLCDPVPNVLVLLIGSVVWFRRAADLGLPEAQFMLGTCYLEGEGMPKDTAEAARWWRLAANQGLPKAQFEMGLAHQDAGFLQADDVLAYVQ